MREELPKTTSGPTEAIAVRLLNAATRTAATIKYFLIISTSPALMHLIVAMRLGPRYNFDHDQTIERQADR